jgi:hypothetical protein
MAPIMAPKRRRPPEDLGQDFRLAATKILHRAVNLPLITPATHLIWDTLHWLRLWEWNDTAGTHEAYEDFHQTEHPNHDFPPHL